MCSLLLVFLPVSLYSPFQLSLLVSWESYILASGQSVFFGCRYIRQGLMHGLKDGNGSFICGISCLSLLQIVPHYVHYWASKEGEPVFSTDKKFFLLHWGECLSEVGEEKLSLDETQFLSYS